MDDFRAHFPKKTSSSFNGMSGHTNMHHHGHGHHGAHGRNADKNWAAYKLIVDPSLKKGHQKLYRYDGIVAGVLGSELDVQSVHDPRSRLSRIWNRKEVADLPVPKFKVDQYFVGELPPKEITFTNLNDNVRENFLRDMCEKFGDVEAVKIFYHPKTRKHLGLAQVTYAKTRFAKEAAMGLNRTPVMGKTIIVQVDAGGKECERTFDLLVNNFQPNTPSSSSTSSGPRDPRSQTDTRRSSKTSDPSSATPSLPPTPQSISDKSNISQFSEHYGDPQTPQFPHGIHSLGPLPGQDNSQPSLGAGMFGNVQMKEFAIPPPPPPPPKPVGFSGPVATLSDFMQPNNRNRNQFESSSYHGEQAMYGQHSQTPMGPPHGYMEPPGLVGHHQQLQHQQQYFGGKSNWNSQGAGTGFQPHLQHQPMQQQPNNNFQYQQGYSEHEFSGNKHDPNCYPPGHTQNVEPNFLNQEQVPYKAASFDSQDQDQFESRRRNKKKKRRRGRDRKRTFSMDSQKSDESLEINETRREVKKEFAIPKLEKQTSSDLSEVNDASQDEEDDKGQSLDSRIEALLMQSTESLEFDADGKETKSPERRNSTSNENKIKVKSADSDSSKRYLDKYKKSVELERRTASYDSPHSKHSASSTHSRSDSFSGKSGNYRHKESPRSSPSRDRHRKRHYRDDYRRRRSRSPRSPVVNRPSNNQEALGDLSPENIGDSPLDESEDVPSLSRVSPPNASQMEGATPISDDNDTNFTSADGKKPLAQDDDEEDRMSMSSLSSGDEGKLEVTVPPGVHHPSQPPPPGEMTSSQALHPLLAQRDNLNFFNPMGAWNTMNNMPNAAPMVNATNQISNANEILQVNQMLQNLNEWMNFKRMGSVPVEQSFSAPQNPLCSFPQNLPHTQQNPGSFTSQANSFPMGQGFGAGFTPFPPPHPEHVKPMQQSNETLFFPGGENPQGHPNAFVLQPGPRLPGYPSHLQMMAGMSGIYHQNWNINAQQDNGVPNSPMNNMGQNFPPPVVQESRPINIPNLMDLNLSVTPNSSSVVQNPNPDFLPNGNRFTGMNPDWSMTFRPRDSAELLVEEILEKMVQELKQIIKKDLGRRMVEASAFKCLETWWDKSLQKSKEREPHTKEKTEPHVHRPLPSILDNKPWTKNFTDGKNVGLETLGLGLGFRAGMPRMPSFKVKRKLPSPSPEDEEEDAVLSDTEKDDTTGLESSSQASDTDKEPRRRQQIYSSSDDDSEDEDDEDEEEDESEEEETDTKKKMKKTLEDDESKTKAHSIKIKVVDDSDSSDEEEEDDDEDDSDDSSESESDSDEASSDEDSSEDDDEEEEDGKSLKSSRSNKRKLATIVEEDMETEVRQEGKDKISSVEERIIEELEKTKVITLELKDGKESPSPTKADETSHLPAGQREAVIPLGPQSDSEIEAIEVLAALAFKAGEVSKEGEQVKAKLPRVELSKMTPEVAEQLSAALKKAEEDIQKEVDEITKVIKDDETVSVDVETVDKDTIDKKTDVPFWDHNYCKELPLAKAKEEKPENVTPLTEKPPEENKKEITAKKRKRRSQLDDLISILADEKEVVAPSPPKPHFTARNYYDEWSLLYDFLSKGLDLEDACYLRNSYETLLQDGRIQWLSYTHWVVHAMTCIPNPPLKRQKHLEVKVHPTGCARTEGFYKITDKEKMKYLSNSKKMVSEQLGMEDDYTSEDVKKMSSTRTTSELSREARSDQRRIMASLANQEGTVSDLLKFNQLKFRKKELKFAKSGIHGWGLYAMEPIAADEMVIEYVGQSIRQSIAEEREIYYEKMGIGSSYLFRIDSECIIDATKCGNLARFINHSCNPNCYAKIITVEAEKKITIYSKQPIKVGEEITYDYKFPIEDEKIACLCGSAQCRGTLN